MVLVEQPLPEGRDRVLAGPKRPIPVCADESAHGLASLPALAGTYDAVNIKLDKAGGLTEALAMAAAAKGMGLGVMAGCMVATSLAMAPAVLLAQAARFVDLDGPLLLAARPRPRPALSPTALSIRPFPRCGAKGPNSRVDFSQSHKARPRLISFHAATDTVVERRLAHARRCRGWRARHRTKTSPPNCANWLRNARARRANANREVGGQTTARH